MTQAVSRRPHVRLRVPSEFGPCEICSGQSGTVAGFPPSTSFSLVGIIPALLHTCHLHVAFLPEGQRSKPGNPPKAVLLQNSEHI
jgi:hypothetical protein